MGVVLGTIFAARFVVYVMVRLSSDVETLCNTVHTQLTTLETTTFVHTEVHVNEREKKIWAAIRKSSP